MAAGLIVQEKPWQNALIWPNDKLKALFYNGNFSDVTVTFKGKDIRYKAHKIILATSSSIFERMLFGPMAITGSELELTDDNPEALRIVLAHCYGVKIEPSNIDVALEVYMLADKYFLEHLCRLLTSSNIIGKMINSENIDKVLEFSSNFSFDLLKRPCFEFLISSNKTSLFLQQDWLNKLLELDIKIPKLVFEDSWKNLNYISEEDTIIQLLKSENCRNEGLKSFSGCVSAKVVNNICWYPDHNDTYNQLYLSFSNLKQANNIITLLDKVKETEWIYIHLQCKMIPSDRLKRITRRPYKYCNNEVELFLSNVDNNGIDWVVSTVESLKPLGGSFEVISFPRSKITFSGFKTLMTHLVRVFTDAIFPHIHMCSSKISSRKKYELENWILSNHVHLHGDAEVKLLDRNEDIDGWDGPIKERGPRITREQDPLDSDYEDYY